MSPATTDYKARTLSFAQRIFSAYRALPQDEVSQVIGRNLIKAGSALGATYTEAVRSFAQDNYSDSLYRCIKELDETQYWLDLIEVEGLLPRELLAELQAETRELTTVFLGVLHANRIQH